MMSYRIKSNVLKHGWYKLRRILHVLSFGTDMDEDKDMIEAVIKEIDRLIDLRVEELIHLENDEEDGFPYNGY